ncbi:ABC transporter permease [Pseudodesulfovibrio pelocollis]|uniref:ABC transporter permease n=1 Tax=Pseudodesulfovibrio pelocollis TaxID=3051432 RepID=UPI00255AE5A5|nr:ABC transporter permease [Pseudodesulfovibrio sp. SB368]
MTHHPLPKDHPGASVLADQDGGSLRLMVRGRLDAPGTAHVWDEAAAAAHVAAGNLQGRDLPADCSAIEYMDGSGVALLLKLREVVAAQGATLALTGLSPQHSQLIDLTWHCPDQLDSLIPERRGLAHRVGMAASETLVATREMVSFVGEASVIIAGVIRHPSRVRWKDVLLSCVQVGVDSLFIITLIGFLMGLIMSFQSAISLQRFGGEIFVPNMLGLVMFREMGPLVTAILLAARSGSAFAAEIGTMKINEELDALTTMGLSPMRFLVVPKLLSALAMVPLMTIFFNLASLVGGALVMLSLGYPLVTFTSRVFKYVHYSDFFGGMAKALVFAVLVAGVGCLRGMQTRSGASAVGLSTTSAVVSGIIFIAFADGLFAVAFYYLKI